MTGVKELVRRRVGDDWRVGIVVGGQGSGKSTAATEAWGDPLPIGALPHGPVQVYDGFPSEKDIVRALSDSYRAPYAFKRVPLKSVFIVNEWPSGRWANWIVRMPEMVLTTREDAGE